MLRFWHCFAQFSLPRTCFHHHPPIRFWLAYAVNPEEVKRDEKTGICIPM
jgi:hypothetical protein